ncbi:response regulator [Bacillus sonorensis]|uniref:response regulator n=1 Tax=Bacillus sonorensis TaxID=119858 RepID=UPI002282BFD7|nr:response regulator [Bacillus sonorensis]MCY8087160.1 response regulator [Bacillus sonorensis]
MYKVLLADDERIILEGISSMIQWKSFGASLVGAVQNGIEAYQLILRERPHIVISDIKMPGMGGLELIEKVSRDHPSIRFILLTGFGQFEYAKKAMTYGVRHYLLKPCNENHITASLESVIDELKKEESAERVKTELDLVRPHIQKHALRELIKGDKSDADAYLRFFPDGKDIRIVLFSVQGEGGGHLSTLEKLAGGILASSAIAAVLIKGVLVIAADGEEHPDRLRDKIEHIKHQAGKQLQVQLQAAVSRNGDIREAAALYDHACGGLDKQLVKPGGQTSVLIDKMLDLVQKEAANPKLSLKWAARNMLYMNPDYLGKLFKQETGEKFSSYVARVRIEKAMAIMKHTGGIPIGELAEKLGFGDNPKYFSLVFKKYTGYTPSEYRKKNEKSRR